MRSFAFVTVALGAMLLLACGGGGGGKATPGSTKASTAGRTPAVTRTTAAASQPATAAQGARHTGIAEVDAVIDAGLAADAERLRPLIAFQRMACNAPGQGPFSCMPDEPQGTVSDVLPVEKCGSTVVRAHELEAGFERLFGSGPRELYGVYRSGADTLVVLSQFPRSSPTNREGGGVMLIIEGGRITRMDLDCGQTAAQMVELAQPEETILAPEARPSPQPFLTPQP